MVLPVVLLGTATVRGRCRLHVREEADGQECWPSALVARGDLRHAHHLHGDWNSLWLTIRQYLADWRSYVPSCANRVRPPRSRGGRTLNICRRRSRHSSLRGEIPRPFFGEAEWHRIHTTVR